MAIHELGHILVIKVCNGKIYSTQASSVGANISFLNRSLSRRQDVAVYAGGPCAGAVAGLAAYAAGFYDFANMSFCLSVLNLLPSVPFDGGGILSSVLPYELSGKVLRITSILTGLILCIVGFCGLIKGGNFTVLASGIGVFISLMGKTSLQ